MEKIELWNNAKPVYKLILPHFSVIDPTNLHGQNFKSKEVDMVFRNGQRARFSFGFNFEFELLPGMPSSGGMCNWKNIKASNSAFYTAKVWFIIFIYVTYLKRSFKMILRTRWLIQNLPWTFGTHLPTLCTIFTARSTGKSS